MAVPTIPVPPSGLTRRILTIALLGAPTTLRAAPCGPPSTVLFVCPAGTVKSAIARETLKARAAKAGVQVRVRSRGLNVEDHVSPGLAANLKADGIDPAAEPARPLSDGDVAAADIVIAFDDAAKALPLARAWDIPSWNDEYPAAKAALAADVDRLVVELRARQTSGCVGVAR